jgi:hypothetical protein
LPTPIKRTICSANCRRSGTSLSRLSRISMSYGEDRRTTLVTV